MKIVDSAILKLTGWYLLLIMLLSLSFSGLLYQVSSRELERGLPHGDTMIMGLFPVSRLELERYRLAQLEASNNRLKARLVVINLATLVAGGALSYLLARRTLQPITEAMDTQIRFTSDASHELKTPLTALHTEIEVALRDASLTKDDLKAQLRSNLEEVDKLQGLTERLLMLTSQRQVEKARSSVKLAALEAVNRHLAAAKQKGITITTKLHDAEVMANAGQLADVIAILLDNAIKYSPDDSQVTVSSIAAGERAIVRVSDHGIGIPKDAQEHIFERFFRSDASRSKQIDGYGLGLSIAKRLVDEHDGTISVDSVPKKGSTFTVSLPRVH